MRCKCVNFNIQIMPKSVVTLATVISMRPSGKNNSCVTFLTQSEGIVHATLYGGPKSKMKSLVSPWNTGTAYFSISNNENYKISDFDAKIYRLSFRENLLKFWAASLAAEIAIKTKCSGNAAKCWALINGFLDGLELCSTDEQCIAGLIRFLWRYLALMGIQPEAENCCRCGKKITDGAVFNAAENGFCCRSCAQKPSGFEIPQNGIEYLNAISELSPKEARNAVLFKESVSSVKQILYYLTENACGTELTSLKTSAGIL